MSGVVRTLAQFGGGVPEIPFLKVPAKRPEVARTSMMSICGTQKRTVTRGQIAWKAFHEVQMRLWQNSRITILIYVESESGEFDGAVQLVQVHGT